MWNVWFDDYLCSFKIDHILTTGYQLLQDFKLPFQRQRARNFRYFPSHEIPVTHSDKTDPNFFDSVRPRPRQKARSRFGRNSKVRTDLLTQVEWLKQKVRLQWIWWFAPGEVERPSFCRNRNFNATSTKNVY
jgi:hypothetical protein